MNGCCWFGAVKNAAATPPGEISAEDKPVECPSAAKSRTSSTEISLLKEVDARLRDAAGEEERAIKGDAAGDVDMDLELFVEVAADAAADAAVGFDDDVLDLEAEC